MNTKRFFYVAAGILLLVVAYSVGADRAVGQAGSNAVVGVAVADAGGSLYGVYAITQAGDAYKSLDSGRNWTLQGNIFGGTVRVESKSMSDVKRLYRK